MKNGAASRTAQAVAAARAGAERMPAPYGDPASDDRLQRLVAGRVSPPGREMSRYLLARTRFFDAQVVSALVRGIEQVIVAAAGYDGRALRYAKTGVRWFEVDHPATQTDKLARLEQIGVDTGHIRFVAADFTVDDVGALLTAAGCDPRLPSLVLAEGIAVYLELATLTTLLHALRSSVAPGSVLAISVSITVSSPDQQARRAAFQQRVSALGEPARTTLTAGDVEQLLDSTGWRLSDAGGDALDRAQRAGLVTAVAV